MSRSFEDNHKMPLLGMERCFDNAVDIMASALAAIVDPAAPPRLRIERLDY